MDPNCVAKMQEKDCIASSSQQGELMQVTEVTTKYINSILIQIEPHFAAILHQYLGQKVTKLAKVHAEECVF